MGKRGPKPIRIKLPKKLLKQYQSGAINLSELAGRIGLSSSTIFRELRRLGLDTSKSTRARLRLGRRAEQIVALYSQGLSLRRVAEQTGLSQEAVRQILFRSKVKLRPSWMHYPLRSPNGQSVSRKHFAARLRALRSGAGLSLTGLAAKSGLHKMTLWKLEAGHQGPKWETLTRLAQALGVGLEAFRITASRPA